MSKNTKKAATPKNEENIKEQATALSSHIKEDGRPVKGSQAKKSKTKTAPKKGKGDNKNTPALSKKDLLWVNPKKLVVVWEDNPRKDYGDMKTLEASITSRGVENPIRVQQLPDGKLKLEAGYRRIKACLSLIDSGVKVATVPAMLSGTAKSTSDKETLLHVFVENDGKPFTVMEEAAIFTEMRTVHKMKIPEIAVAVGRTAFAIRSKLQYMAAAESLQEALQQSKISPLTATRIIAASKKDVAVQDKLLSNYLASVERGTPAAIKEANDVVARDAGRRDNSCGVSHHKAKKLLEDVANAYTVFARTQKPANKLNKAWVELESQLKKLRTMKRKGDFS